MKSYEIRLPRIDGATDREKIEQIRRFLCQLVEELNFILGDIAKEDSGNNG